MTINGNVKCVEDVFAHHALQRINLVKNKDFWYILLKPKSL